MNQMPLSESPDRTETSLKFQERVIRYMFNKYGSNKPLMNIIFEMMSDLKPFPVGAIASINIPVAGHQEAIYVYNSLLSYSQQGQHLAGNVFEINLFVNAPEPTPDNPYSWEDTLYEIDRFQNDFPHIHTNVVTSRLSKAYLDIGIIRGIITDAHLLRPGMHPDHVIISNDADQIGIHPLYIRKILEIFQNSDVQICGGKVDEDPITHLNYPDLFVCERFGQFLAKNINISGANSAYRASAYIQVGGYQSVHGKCGEDTSLGQRIMNNSWDKKCLGHHAGNSRVLRVVTSGRREAGLIMEYGKRPGRHAWEKVLPNGSSETMEFGPNDFYRNIQMYPDVRKLLSILGSDASWIAFLKTIAPHIFQKIYFQRQSFSRIEDGVQKEYGTDENRRKEISKAFGNIQVLEYSDHKREEMDLCSSVVDFPLHDFPRNARRALYYLGVEEIDCKVGFCPNSPMGVFVDIQITRADMMRAGLQKFLDKMKAKYRI